MLKWNALHDILEKTSIRHRQLASRFDVFAKFACDQLTAKSFHIKGITAELHGEQGFFTTTFAGRVLDFVFSSTSDSPGSLIGTVKCYIKRDVPQLINIELGGFTFNGSGQTNLIDPENNDPIYIDSDIPSLYVALHFIHESLTH